MKRLELYPVRYFVGPRLSALRLVGFRGGHPDVRYLTDHGVFRECGRFRYWATRALSRVFYGR